MANIWKEFTNVQESYPNENIDKLKNCYISANIATIAMLVSVITLMLNSLLFKKYVPYASEEHYQHLDNKIAKINKEKQKLDEYKVTYARREKEYNEMMEKRRLEWELKNNKGKQQS